MKRRRGGYINRARKYSFSIENFSSGGILKEGIVESSVFFYPFSFLLFFIRITSTKREKREFAVPSVPSGLRHDIGYSREIYGR